MSQPVSASAYKTAKLARTVFLVLLVLSVPLLIWECILVVTKDISRFTLLSPIINVCLFAVLFLTNHFQVKKYLKQQAEKPSE